MNFLDLNGLTYFKGKLDTLFENKSNKTNTINASSTNEQYPSAKAVYDYVELKLTPVETPNSAGGITFSIGGNNG